MIISPYEFVSETKVCMLIGSKSILVRDKFTKRGSYGGGYNLGMSRIALVD